MERFPWKVQYGVKALMSVLYASCFFTYNDAGKNNTLDGFVETTISNYRPLLDR
jgi:hypothetical protein